MSQSSFAICKLIYPSFPQILFDVSKYLIHRSFIITFPILTYHIVVRTEWHVPTNSANTVFISSS